MIAKRVSRLTAVVLIVGTMTAQGEVTVFGHGDANQARVAPPDQTVESSPECINCTFGFDGNNDLGNGLKAIYRLDWEYHGGNSTSPDSRDRWLGISGNFGEVKVGTLSTGYKSDGVLPDPVYRTSSVNGRAAQPVQNGHKADNNVNADKDDGVGLSYENAGVLIFADYITGTTGNEDTTYKVGAKYGTQNFAVFGQYKFDTGVADGPTTGNPGENTDIWFLGGSVFMGNTSIYAGYGKGEDGASASALSGYNSWEVVGVQSVSKLTSIYAGYSGTGCTDKNADVCNKAGTEGVDDDKFSLGIRHKF